MQTIKFKYIFAFNIILLVLALFLNPRFQTNDDVGMIYAFSGTGIFETPTPVTAFGTKIFGMLMVFLYKISPINIEVYTVVLMFLIFISNIVIHNKILQNSNHKQFYFWLIFIPLLSFISFYFYIELQFTMVAGWLGLAGSLAILNKPRKQDIILGFVLIFFSSLLRPTIVPIILVFAFILNIVLVIISKESLNSLKPIALKYLLFLSLFLSVYLFDIQIHTKEEKQFLDFNTFRSGIVDFNINETKRNSSQFNWEKEELNLFKNWFYNDSILYNKFTNYKFVTRDHPRQFLDKISIKNIKLSKLINQFIGPTYRCILLLAFIPILFLRRSKENFLLLATIVLIYISYYIILSIFFKEPPFRVSFMLFSAGIVYYLYATSIKKEEEVISYINGKSILGYMLLIYGFWITKISSNIRSNDLFINNCKEIYNSNLMYIRWKDYPYDYDDPFSISKSMNNIKLVSMGAFSIHPGVKNSFGKFKYSNLTSDIIGKDSIISFLLPKDKIIWKDLEESYVKFIRKHYNSNIYFEEVKNIKHCYGYSEFKIKLKVNESKVD